MNSYVLSFTVSFTSLSVALTNAVEQFHTQVMVIDDLRYMLVCLQGKENI